MISRLAQLLRSSPVPFAAGAVVVSQPDAAIEGRAGRLAVTPARIAGGVTTRVALGNIQVLRGVAALAVLLCHVLVYMQAMRGTALPPRQLDQLSGQMGVAIFFVISGFLMAGLVARGDPWRFLAHRVIRIFPTYFAVVALFGFIFAALKIGFGINLFALSLAPVGPRSYPLNVEWTLVFETSFYVGLFLLAWAGSVSWLVPVALGWIGLLAVAWFILPHSPLLTMNPTPYLLLLSPACVAFAGGLLLPRLIARGWIRPALAWLAFPLLVAAVPVDGEARRWFAAGAAVFLVGGAICGRQVTRDNRLGRAAIAFGDWSYVLYLVHVPLILLIVRYAPSTWSGPGLWVSAIAAALATTVLLGPIDVLFYRLLRRRIDTASPARLRRGLAVYLAIFFGFAVSASVEIHRNAWQEDDAHAALAALPDRTWASDISAEAAITERGLGLPASVRGGIEGFERVSSTDFMLGAWAFDLEKPKRQMLLAAFCGGQLVGLDRPSRLRPKLVTLPGLDTSRGKRIGYRLRVPERLCAPGEAPVAVLVGAEGHMAILHKVSQPIEGSEAP